MNKDIKEFNSIVLSSVCITFLLLVGVLSYMIGGSYALFYYNFSGEKTMEVVVANYVIDEIVGEYSSTGEEEKLIVPNNGIYKLEVWGAQGGSYSETYHGGYGGYSVAYIYLNKDEELFINVGGAGVFESGYKYGAAGGGGSGYIANTNLFDKYMVCYGCAPSDLEATRTYTNNNVSETPKVDYSKIGNGYARVRFVE